MWTNYVNSKANSCIILIFFSCIPLTSNLYSTFVDICSLDGIDYLNNIFSKAVVANEAECSKSCQKLPYCALYGYSKSSRQCWLKTKEGPVVINSDIQTGYKKIKLEGNNEFTKLPKYIRLFLFCSANLMLSMLSNAFLTRWKYFFVKNNTFFEWIDSCHVNGVDYPYNDFDSFPVTNALDCHEKCQSHPNCVLYAYSLSRSYCWLKSKQGDAVLNDDIFTGFKTTRGKWVFGIFLNWGLKFVLS